MTGGCRGSGLGGGSDDTMDKVLLQWGHWKQLRAHLKTMISLYVRGALKARMQSPILFGSYASTGNLKETVWTIITTDFNGNASVASHSITFLAEI